MVDSFLRLRPDALVPCHSRPVEGAGRVRDVLLAYRDAIQFVHDQAVRLMNKGGKKRSFLPLSELLSFFFRKGSFSGAFLLLCFR